MLTESELRAAPKAVLHDHLDGGLRPATIVELAEAAGYQGLPTRDPVELEAGIRSAADAGSLVGYLATFEHTVAVMQTVEAIRRVAYECAEDLVNDGVVYAEIRFAPELHVEDGLSMEQVVGAVLEGFEAAALLRGPVGFPLVLQLLLTAMRHAARSVEVADLAIEFRDRGVCGFDIAGAEAGNPPTRHLDAFQRMQRANMHFTVHAGEAFGLPSIWEALQWCNADRLGHGVRIVDDIVCGTDGSAELGQLAGWVRDTRVPLEMCPTSNVHTGAARSVAEHPIGLLRRLGFRVTVNTDNRLMSGVSMSSELAAVCEAFDYGWADVQWFTINAIKSAFLPFDQRLEIINTIVKPWYAERLAAG